MRHAFLALTVLGFVFGVFFRSFVAFSWSFALLIIIVGFFIFLFSRLKKGGALVFVSIFLLAFGLGILRYDIKDSLSVSDELKPKIDQRVLLKGTIYAEPDERENSTRLIFREDSGDKILLVTNRYPEYSYGDVLEVRGILKEPDNFLDFDYKAYLAKDDILLEMIFPEIQKTGEGAGWKIKAGLLTIKKKYLAGLSKALPEPQAAFIGGLTVGARRAIPSDVIDDFRKAGIIHIIVLSGFHVTTVARAVATFFGSFLPHTLSIFAGLFGIFLFAILTGASATVVRASIMAAILYLAGLSGRVYQAKIALFTAGIIMILINPKILRFDLGFQLSFLATAGILYLSPYIERFIKWLPEKFKIREYGKITISAQIAVTPLLLYTMGTFSIVAIPANLMILGFVPATMLFGFLTGATSIVHPWIAAPFSWITYVLSSYSIYVAEFFARLPFSSINF